MSNRLFQGLVYQMRDTVDRMIGVIDESATIIACSDLTKIGEPNDFLAADLGENNELFIRDGITYKPFGSKMKSEYAVFVSGSDDLAAKMCGVLSISLSSIKQYYDEKYDRGNFIKNIILDNILPGDIFAKARELHFSSDASRAVLLVRVQANSSVSAFDVVQNLFPDKQKDFVFNVNETDIVLVKEVKPGIESKDLEKLARSIVDTLGGEFYTKAQVGIGSVIAGIKDLARSFREAQARWRWARYSIPSGLSSAMITWVSRASFISCPPPCASSTCARSLRKAPSKAWITRPFSPFRSSSRTT